MVKNSDYGPEAIAISLSRSSFLLAKDCLAFIYDIAIYHLYGASVSVLKQQWILLYYKKWVVLAKYMMYHMNYEAKRHYVNDQARFIAEVVYTMYCDVIKLYFPLLCFKHRDTYPPQRNFEKDKEKSILSIHLWGGVSA